MIGSFARTCLLILFCVDREIHSVITDLTMTVTTTPTDITLLCHQIAKGANGYHRANSGKDLLDARACAADAKMLHHLPCSSLHPCGCRLSMRERTKNMQKILLFGAVYGIVAV